MQNCLAFYNIKCKSCKKKNYSELLQDTPASSLEKADFPSLGILFISTAFPPDPRVPPTVWSLVHLQVPG